MILQSSNARLWWDMKYAQLLRFMRPVREPWAIITLLLNRRYIFPYMYLS